MKSRELELCLIFLYSNSFWLILLHWAPTTLRLARYFIAESFVRSPSFVESCSTFFAKIRSWPRLSRPLIIVIIYWVFYCHVRCSNVLYYFELHCTVLLCTAELYTVLYCIIVYWTVIYSMYCIVQQSYSVLNRFQDWDLPVCQMST